MSLPAGVRNPAPAAPKAQAAPGTTRDLLETLDENITRVQDALFGLEGRISVGLISSPSSPSQSNTKIIVDSLSCPINDSLVAAIDRLDYLVNRIDELRNGVAL